MPGIPDWMKNLIPGKRKNKTSTTTEGKGQTVPSSTATQHQQHIGVSPDRVSYRKTVVTNPSEPGLAVTSLGGVSDCCSLNPTPSLTPVSTGDNSTDFANRSLGSVFQQPSSIDSIAHPKISEVNVLNHDCFPGGSSPDSTTFIQSERQRTGKASETPVRPLRPCEASETPARPLRPFIQVEIEDMEVEMFPESALNTPVGALRRSRRRLCLMLNIEQQMIETDWSPDYRGLADMLGFDSIEIQNFYERNPSDTLFMEWARCQDSHLLQPVLRTLVQCLEALGRRDILQDCRGLILEDVSDFIAEQQLLDRYAVASLATFDCYVNIADQDLLTVGREILETLEGVYNLRLCLTLRDVALGGCVYDRMAEMLETRCNSKVLIVLSRNYENSDACQFLTQFAVTLDPGSRRNKLIPLLVDEDTAIPRVLRCLAMLNFHRDRRLGFLWPRMKQAITT